MGFYANPIVTLYYHVCRVRLTWCNCICYAPHLTYFNLIVGCFWRPKYQYNTTITEYDFQYFSILLLGYYKILCENKLQNSEYEIYHSLLKDSSLDLVNTWDFLLKCMQYAFVKLQSSRLNVGRWLYAFVSFHLPNIHRNPWWGDGVEHAMIYTSLPGQMSVLKGGH